MATNIADLQSARSGRAMSPFGDDAPDQGGDIGGAIVSSQALASIQGAVVMAKKFPRNQAQAMNRIKDACTRPRVAEQAEYAYPRGGQTVSGPSIRLAEVIAQNWGNIDFGVVELDNSNNRSHVMAYCWDLETNTRQQRTFVVEHIRYTRNKGNEPLNDPRDIYEMVANQGARRVRACILGVIPGDVVDTALDACHVTLKNTMQAPEDEIKSMIAAFAEFGVSEAAIKKRLGKDLKAVIAAEVIRLRSIYASIRDGMSQPADWFDLGAGAVVAPTGGMTKPKQEEVTGRKDIEDAVGAGSNDFEAQLEERGFYEDGGKYFNSHQEVWNPEEHATGGDGFPVINKNGKFRSRRNAKTDNEETHTGPASANQDAPPSGNGFGNALD